MNKKKLTLFIGNHKVGSTALQRFLSGNSMALSQAGYLYPYVTQDFVEGFIRKSNRKPLHGKNFFEPHNALAFRMMHESIGYPIPPWHPQLPKVNEMFDMIDAQIRSMDKPPHLLICSEVFANFGAINDDLIGKLANKFSEYDVKVLCVLRRPDDYIVSWHGQRLRFGHKIQALRDGGQRSYYDTIHFDYKLLVSPWLAYFGKQAVTVVDYFQIVSEGGLVEFFRNFAGLDKSFLELASDKDNINSRMNLGCYEVARLANHRLSAPAAAEVLKYLKSDMISSQIPRDSDVEMYGDSLRAELYDRFGTVRERLIELLGEESGMFNDISGIRKAKTVSEFEHLQESFPIIQRNCGAYAFKNREALDFIRGLNSLSFLD